MGDTLLTGIIAIVGVVIGGLMSFLTTFYTEKKSHSNDVQKIKKEIIIKKLSNINELINHLPSSNAEFNTFRNYLLNIYYKSYSETDTTLEMLYLSDDMRRKFAFIDRYVNTEIIIDCDYKAIKRMIIAYRTILIKMIQDELYIKPKLLQTKLKIKKTKTYIKQEAQNYVNAILEDEVETF